MLVGQCAPWHRDTEDKVSAVGSQLQGPPASVTVPWLSQGRLWLHMSSVVLGPPGPGVASLQEKAAIRAVRPPVPFPSAVVKTARGDTRRPPSAQCRPGDWGPGGPPQSPGPCCGDGVCPFYTGRASELRSPGPARSQCSHHVPSPRASPICLREGRGRGLTLMLASSRPLLLPSLSTKRGSTEDALEMEAQNQVSFRAKDQTPGCSSAGWPVCGHMAPGPRTPSPTQEPGQGSRRHSAQALEVGRAGLPGCPCSPSIG